MEALLQAALAPYNVVYTGLLIIIMIYWVTVLLGAIDIGALDFDIDADVDIDADLDVDVDTDTDVGHSIGWFAGALHFFNFGKLPFMIIMTFLVLSMWSISVLGNHYIGNGTALFALLLILPNLFISLVITKIVTIPLIPVFKDYQHAGVQAVDYMGLICTLRLPTTSTQIGQAEVIHNGDSLLITVQAMAESLPILKGEQAVIVDQSEDGKYYYVKKMEDQG